jgi:hypothetical protein
MSEEFDKQLKDHITDVFDNYEDSSAGAGWALLREKYPEKDKKRPVAWWWFGVAAGLLLILGAALWLSTGEKTPQALKQITSAKPSHRDSNTGHTLLQPSTVPDSVTAVPIDRAAVSVEPGDTRNTHQNNKGIAARTPYLKHRELAPAIASSKRNTSITGKDEPAEPLIVNTNPSISTNDTAKSRIGIAANNKQVILPKNDTAAGIKTDTIAKVKRLTAATDQKKAATAAKKLSWSVFVSGYNSYANNSNSNFNSGAGVGTDIALSKSFKLLTGIGLFQNKFNYDPTSNGVYYTLPAGSGSSSYTSSFTTYSADQLALEVPLKLSLQLSKRGNNIAVGISSAIYASEKHRQTFSSVNVNTSTQVSTPTSTEVVTQTYFSTFAFAKSLDLSAGFGYQLGKNRIVLEPFVKIPFNSLNRSDLRYGAIGTSLRFAFGAGR